MRLTCMVLTGLMMVAAIGAAQDVVFLKDGQKFTGKVIKETSSLLDLEVDYGQIRIKKVKIKMIFKGVDVAGKSMTSAQNGIMDLGRSTLKSGTGIEPTPPSEATEATRKKHPRDSVRSQDHQLQESRGKGAPVSNVHPLLSGEKVEQFFITITEKMGPFFPRKTSSRIALTILFFLVCLGLVQLGCRYMDVEHFSIGRGICFNLMLGFLLYGWYMLNHMLVGPLTVFLSLLIALLILAATAGTLFQVRAGKSTMLVGFVLISGGGCLTCITIGVIGVVNLY